MFGSLYRLQSSFHPGRQHPPSCVGPYILRSIFLSNVFSICLLLVLRSTFHFHSTIMALLMFCIVLSCFETHYCGAKILVLTVAIPSRVQYQTIKYYIQHYCQFNQTQLHVSALYSDQHQDIAQKLLKNANNKDLDSFCDISQSQLFIFLLTSFGSDCVLFCNIINYYNFQSLNQQSKIKKTSLNHNSQCVLRAAYFVTKSCVVTVDTRHPVHVFFVIDFPVSDPNI